MIVELKYIHHLHSLHYFLLALFFFKDIDGFSFAL